MLPPPSGVAGWPPLALAAAPPALPLPVSFVSSSLLHPTPQVQQVTGVGLEGGLSEPALDPAVAQKLLDRGLEGGPLLDASEPVSTGVGVRGVYSGCSGCGRLQIGASFGLACRPMEWDGS